MTTNQQPKVPMHAVKSSADPGASQGARRATEEAPGSAPPSGRPGNDAEVVPRARRRQFSTADKRRILQAVDNCSKPGEIGALMRREGVYSSSLSTWRLRDSGVLIMGARYSDKGLVVLAAKDEPSARAMMDEDPSIKAEVFKYQIHPFSVFYGGTVSTRARRAGQ